MNVPVFNPVRRHRRKTSARILSAFHTLQFKASMMVVALSLGLVVFYMTSLLRTISNGLVRNEIELAQRKAEYLAVTGASHLAGDVGPRAQAVLKQAAEDMIRTSGTVYAAFTDCEGVVIAAAVARDDLPEATFPTEGEHLAPIDADLKPLTRQPTKDCSYIHAGRPIIASGVGTHGGPGSEVLGHVRLVTDLAPVMAEVAGITGRLHTATWVILILVIPGSLLITRRLVAPLHELARAARALANGVMDARVPVRSRNEIGQLAQSFNMMASRVTQSQMELLQLAAELEARVQDRTRELQELASKDSLTGLYNRRHFSEVMAREFAAAERYQSDLTCLMFDLDHFKQINDRFGHTTGDEALILLADAIRSQLRSADIAARFGGDEFILLLPRTGSTAAHTLAGRIQKEYVTRARHAHPDLPAGLSIGIASLLRTRVTSAEALANEADLALYAAKAHGRDRMMEAPPATERKAPRHTKSHA